MEGLNDLERTVLDRLLEGDHPSLALLRRQADAARLVSRESSGVGFFCLFEVPADVPRLERPESFELSDVNADIDGLAHGAGFVLFVRDGRLQMLEGFSYDEAWPADQVVFEVSYQRSPRDLEALGPVGDRKSKS